MKIDLTPSQRRALRAKAHHLHPVVTIGQHGLTPAVLHEVDVALLAHELIKIRAFSDGRDARDALLEQICATMGAAPVQHLGKVFTIWRQAPAVEAPAAPAREKRLRGPAARSTGKTSSPPATAGKSRQRGAPAESTVGSAGKQRKVTGGKRPAERKYAPPTAKGPFEPGRRAPRAGGAKAPSSAARSRRRRTQA